MTGGGATIGGGLSSSGVAVGSGRGIVTLTADGDGATVGVVKPPLGDHVAGHDEGRQGQPWQVARFWRPPARAVDHAGPRGRGRRLM